MSDALSKKFSLDDLLDGINDAPDDIDTLIIGSVIVGAKKSSQLDNVKGLPFFAEVIDFITHEGRVPLATAGEWKERVLAHRLQGYAKNPNEYRELIPFDTHSIIGCEALIEKYTPITQEQSTTYLNDVPATSLDERQPTIDDLFSVGHFELDQPSFFDEPRRKKTDKVNLPMPVAPVVAEIVIDEPVLLVEAVEPAPVPVPVLIPVPVPVPVSVPVSVVDDITPVVELTPDVVEPVADVELSTPVEPVVFDELYNDIEELILDEPVVTPQAEIEVIPVPVEVVADDITIPEFYITSPLCSRVSAPPLDILYRQAALCSIAALPSLNILYRKSSVFEVKYNSVSKLTKEDAPDTATVTAKQTPPLSDKSFTPDNTMPADKPIDKPVPEVYIAIHIDERRYQDYINPQSVDGYEDKAPVPQKEASAQRPPASNQSIKVNGGSQSPIRDTTPRSNAIPSTPFKSPDAHTADVYPKTSPISADKSWFDTDTDTDERYVGDFNLDSPSLEELNATYGTTAPSSIDDILDSDFDLINDLAATENEWFVGGYQSDAFTQTKSPAKPDEVGKQTKCHDFYLYKPRLESINRGLKDGHLKTIKYSAVNIKENDAFILNGMIGFIQSMGELRIGNNGSHDPRLRIIFDNGTESNILLSTLNKNLYMDETGRRVIASAANFRDFEPVNKNERVRTGQLYIVRSLSTDPKIRDIRNLYKIGFTTKNIESRAYNSRNDTAFLESTVEVVATAECYDLNPRGLEGVVHDFLYAQRLLITLTSKDGNTYHPQEWFCVDINDAKLIVQLIINERLTGYRMDNTTGRLVER